MSDSIYRRINDITTWRDQAMHKLHVKAQVEKWDSTRLDERLNDTHIAYQEKMDKLLKNYGNTRGK